jgi:anti-sigma regulatory factor (Ser/Thr protein kinase)
MTHLATARLNPCTSPERYVGEQIVSLSRTEVPARCAEVRLGLLGEEISVRIVRKLLRASLEAWNVPYLIDNASIVTSELVTNAVKATPDEWIEFYTQLLPEGLMVGCWDSSPELPTSPEPTDHDAEGGRGMLVIARYAMKNGVTRVQDRQGKAVWALLSADEGDSEAASWTSW